MKLLTHVVPVREGPECSVAQGNLPRVTSLVFTRRKTGPGAGRGPGNWLPCRQPVRGWPALWLVWLGLVVAAVRADPIPGLFATGVDEQGRVLAAGARDPHWELAASADPAYPGPATWVVNDGFPIPPWFANSSTSRWIGPRADAAAGARPGAYVYRLRFSLEGFDPTTAVVTGRWSSDNEGLDIRVNGVSTGVSFDGDFSRFSGDFRLASGFVDGLNVLEFVVNNAGGDVNPTGFRAELAGAADPQAPPGTPPSWAREPEDRTAGLGESVTLGVVVRGAGPLLYQWRFNGLPLARATNATFTIPSFAPAWVGGYSMVVSNAWGSLTSRVARLTLGYTPPDRRLAEPPGPSSRASGLVFSEIHYHPADRPDRRNLEFVELYNSNPWPEDLGGWRITGEWEMEFPAGTRLGGREYLVVAADPAVIREVHGITNIIGGVAGALANSGGVLRLRKPSGAVVLEVEYDDEDPWPAAADGGGPSLVLDRASLGEADPRAWRASTLVGGSPGGPDPSPAGPWEGIQWNEVLAHAAPGQTEFVELFNPAPFERALDGCVLRLGSDGPRFVVPVGTRMPAGGFVSLSPAGWNLPASGAMLLLYDPPETRVLDAVRYPGQGSGHSAGRWPDGHRRWTTLSAPTPDGPNAPVRAPSVVVSELHYHPLGEREDLEFVEIHNAGSGLADVSGWRLDRGIQFEFPAGTVLAAGQRLAVARRADALRAAHPALPGERVIGNFSGSLSDRGERLVLSRPELEVVRDAVSGRLATNRFPVPVEAFTYRDSGQWPRRADGQGSTLERIDVRAEPDLPGTWAASDDSAAAPWTLIEASGTVDLVHPAVPAADQLQVLLLGEGEALLDDVEVLVGGANRVRNGSFETGLTGWFTQGTHRLSRLGEGAGTGGSRALRVVASDRGDHVANRIRTVLSSPVATGARVTIRARARWVSGHPELLLRLRNGGFEAVGVLAVPPGLGSPGRPGAVGTTHAPPAVTRVRHEPVLPAAGEAVRVTAFIQDPDGIRQVELRWRRDPDATLVRVPMRDDGLAPDERAGDGVFSAQVPGQVAGTLVAFHVSAIDASVSPREAIVPAGAPARECLIRFGEPADPGGLGAYRLWLTDATVRQWSGREQMSNEGLDGTLVVGTNRVIYNVQAHYSGSSYTSPGYDSPVGALCGYDLTVPGDDRLLGGNELLLDWPIRDSTALREPLMFWFLEKLGLPNMHRRPVHLYVNGRRRGSLYEDIQQPNSRTVEQWFSGDDLGSLWKTDCWNEFNDGGGRLDPCVLNTLQPFLSGGVKKVARYRWNWRPRAVRGSANDFTDIFQLIDALNVPTGLVASAESVVDVDHWMRTFAMNDLASYWDGFGNPNGKNTFLYKPERDGWKLMSWDFDVGLGVFNDPPNAALFDVNDPVVARMYQTPALVRRYWAALDEALNGFFQTGPGTAIDAFLDSRHAALRAAGTGVSSPDPIKSWIQQRRSFLSGQVAPFRRDFAITSNGGADLTTTASEVTLTGTAPVRVAALQLNGVEWPVTWTGVNQWSLRAGLLTGTNLFELRGVDRTGQAVPLATDSLRVISSGVPAPPQPILLNEWMASNRSAVADPADGAFDDWFELYHAGDLPVDLAGYTLTDDLARPGRYRIPSGFVLRPGGHLLVWADGQPEQTVPGQTLHVNFRLDRGGSDLALFDPLGRRVDAVRFGEQAVDVPEGRWGDGAGEPFLRLAASTPGMANSPPAVGALELRLVLEWGAEGTVLELDWNSHPGRRYRLATQETVGGAWQPLDPVLEATGPETRAQVTVEPGAEARFFRVELLP